MCYILFQHPPRYHKSELKCMPQIEMSDKPPPPSFQNLPKVKLGKPIISLSNGQTVYNLMAGAYVK